MYNINTSHFYTSAYKDYFRSNYATPPPTLAIGSSLVVRLILNARTFHRFYKKRLSQIFSKRREQSVPRAYTFTALFLQSFNLVFRTAAINKNYFYAYFYASAVVPTVGTRLTDGDISLRDFHALF